MNRDTSLLQAALVGCQQELSEIDQAVAEIRAELKGRQVNTFAVQSDGQPTHGQRVISAAVRRRMAAAQKRRWEAYRKQKAKTA